MSVHWILQVVNDTFQNKIKWLLDTFIIFCVLQRSGKIEERLKKRLEKRVVGYFHHILPYWVRAQNGLRPDHTDVSYFYPSAGIESNKRVYCFTEPEAGSKMNVSIDRKV